MNNKKVIIILSIVILMVLGVLLLMQRHPEANYYKEVLDKISNEETFNILIVNESDTNKTARDTAKIFEYYKDLYGVKYIRVDGNVKDSDYMKLIKKIDSNLNGQEPIIFSMFDTGKPVGNMIGEFKEPILRDYFINNKIISEEYKDIDVVMDNNLVKYLKSKKSYCILYIDPSNNNSFAYRKILVDNKIRSLIMYTGQANQIEIEKYFKEKLKITGDVSEKLPMTIKIRSNKVLYSYSNVKLDDLVDKCK